MLSPILAVLLLAGGPPPPATYSIVAADPAAGEVGVAVASRFFSVGSVVPHARAGAGAVATQSYANTSYGPRGLDLLERGLTPEEVLAVLLRDDPERERRQVGIVAPGGAAVSYTGPGCTPWAGGRAGPGYAVQGNILAGEKVVAAMEESFRGSAGRPLAERLHRALAAGEAAGGDARGKQSAALLVVRAGGGYGGWTDRAIDLRVDDAPDPVRELGRLVDLGLVNDLWNRGWTAFTQKRFPEARVHQEEAARRAEGKAEVLPEVLYDLAVIRLAAGDRPAALAAARRAIALNPGLAAQAARDADLSAIRDEVLKP